jgi:hypothetical protein
LYGGALCDFLRNFLVDEVLVGGWEREKGIGDIGRVKMRERVLWVGIIRRWVRRFCITVSCIFC